MRTTLTLDDHLLQTLKKEAAERPGYDLDTLGRIAEEQADNESLGRSQ